MLLKRRKRVSLTRSCYFNSMAMKLLGFVLLTVFQCFFRRIFATTLKHSDLRAVATWLKEDNSAKSWPLSIATSVSGKNEKLTSKTFSAPWAFHKHEWSFFERYYTSYEAWRPTSHAQSKFYKWQSDEMAENGLFVCIISTRIRRIISTLWMESKLI